jgi:hypothetical protein
MNRSFVKYSYKQHKQWIMHTLLVNMLVARLAVCKKAFFLIVIKVR